MTVIAFRKGVMAADSQIVHTHGDSKVHKLLGCTKVMADDGWLIGVAGANCPDDAAMLDWFDVDTAIPYRGRFSFVVLAAHRKRGLKLGDHSGIFLDLDAPYYAIGAGSDYALGAMAVGATAIEAVRAGIKHSPECGGTVKFKRWRL